MSADLFEERLAKVRHRFASTLEGRIADACRALPRLIGNDAAAARQLAETYPQIHGLCGIGASVGFAATSKTARDAEAILLSPYKSQRGLTAAEGQLLEKALEALLAAAQSELQSVHAREG